MRQAQKISQLDILHQDLNYSFRILAKNRLFTATALLILATGIGGNVAIFSAINALLLQPLRYKQPDRLMAIWEIVPQSNGVQAVLPANPKHVAAWRKQSRSFEDIAEMGTETITVKGTGDPEQVTAGGVSWNFFQLLGVRPRLGRSFLAEEDQKGRGRVAILADSIWRRRFGADPSIVGRRILVDGSPYLVIGVLSPDFRMPAFESSEQSPGAEIFKPLGLDPEEYPEMGEFDFGVVARLRPGASLDQAQTELNVIQSWIGSRLRDRARLHALVRPFQDAIVSPARQGLLVLFGASLAVLLVVCTNLASLQLVRAIRGGRETAIRVALGASGKRIMRQMMTQNMLLGLAGGGLGLLFAHWAVGTLVRTAPVDLPRLDEVRLDSTVLLFAFVISILVSVAFGMLPSWRLAQQDPAEALKSGTRSVTESRRGARIREFMLSTEIAVTIALVAATGLLITSFFNLLTVDKGFRTGGVSTIRVTLPTLKYSKPESVDRFYTSVLARLRELPGVLSSGLVSVLPLQGDHWVNAISIEGDQSPVAQRPHANYRFASPGYFKTVGIPLIAGRVFEERDRGLRTAMVSQSAARALWPGEDPLGKRFWRSSDHAAIYTVVGVAGDIRAVRLQDRPGLVVYVSYWDHPGAEAWLVLESRSEPARIGSAVRALVRNIDDQVPAGDVQPLETIVSGSVAQRHFQVQLLSLFALFSVFLAAAGIYAVAAEVVTRKTGEIGIRMALGASPAVIRMQVLRQSMLPVAAGILAGLALSLTLGKLLNSLLFDVRSSDPLTLSGTIVILSLVAVLSSYLPARRASRMDVMMALRSE